MIGKSIIHFGRYFIGLDEAETQTSINERKFIKALVKDKKRVVEIGVFEGATTRLLADNMSDTGDLYAVDPFFPGRIGICWGRFIAKKEVKKYKANTHVKFIETLSHEAIHIIDGEFDFIFVDGDHSLEGIKRDWEDWSDRICTGGIIALHDTKVPSYNKNVKNLGSYKYFESHIRHDNRFSIINQVDSLSVLKRT